MASPLVPNPASLPLNVLFPEEYRASKRHIVRDFFVYSSAIVLFVVSVVAIYG
jgi:hypothetical protein